MKKILIIASLFFSLNASAIYRGPILAKYNSSGYVPPEWDRSERCELYFNKVVITKRFGRDTSVSETRDIELKGSLTRILAAAQQEELLREPNNLCDAPGTAIRGYMILPNDNVETVQLFNTGGCGSDSLNRSGPYSSMLKDLINNYCPTTHLPH